jgi:hypothetical protein
LCEFDSKGRKRGKFCATRTKWSSLEPSMNPQYDDVRSKNVQNYIVFKSQGIEDEGYYVRRMGFEGKF